MKVIVNAKALAELIGPESTAEIASNAVAQVGEMLARKVRDTAFTDNIFREIENDLKRRYGSTYNAHPEVRAAMLAQAKMSIDQVVGERLDAVVKQAATEVMGRMEKKINTLILDTIALKFKDMVQAASMLRR